MPKYVQGTPEATEYVDRHTRQIMDRIASKRRNRVLRLWMKVAAVLLVGLTITYLVWPEGTIKKNGATAVVTEPASYNRYLTLPDSSTVILGESSSLQLAQGFGNTNRELILKGEAYFDVRHNTSLPFVIQTGKVKTTVLGTAFNIKQAGDSVSVTVTRGKVRVERDDKVLAELVPGQQIATNDQTTIAELKKTEVEPVVAWMQEGLHFNNTTLGDAVARLRERYGTKIVLNTPGLERCRINVETSFKGTESLHVILDVICAVLGANYSYTHETVVITGRPCDS